MWVLIVSFTVALTPALRPCEAKGQLSATYQRKAETPAMTVA